MILRTFPTATGPTLSSNVNRPNPRKCSNSSIQITGSVCDNSNLAIAT